MSNKCNYYIPAFSDVIMFLKRINKYVILARRSLWTEQPR